METHAPDHDATEPASDPTIPLGDRRRDPNALMVMLVDHLNRLNDNQTKTHEIQKKELRWKNIRTAAWLTLGALSIGIYVLISMLFYSSVHDGPPSEDYVSLLRIDGMIASDQKVSAQRINPALVRAFRDNKSKGVVLLINSPGGSPVQASLIRDRLMELRKEFPDKKVVTVAEDALASGAYMIATGTQEIYVNRSTIAGSIGVIMSGFGFDGIIGRFGIERRIYTSGENKSRLDSFKPVSKEDIGKIQGVLADVHRHFIDAVVEARKDKLRGDQKLLFSGDFWTGERAVELGLADGMSDLPTVLRTVFDVEHTRDYTPVPNIFERFAERVPSIGQELLDNFLSSSDARYSLQ